MFLTNQKAQTGAWEGLIIILLLALLGFTAYLWATKQTQSSFYGKDSNPRVSEIQRHDYPLSIHIGEGGCIREGKLNDVIINKARNLN